MTQAAMHSQAYRRRKATQGSLFEALYCVDCGEHWMRLWGSKPGTKPDRCPEHAAAHASAEARRRRAEERESRRVEVTLDGERRVYWIGERTTVLLYVDTGDGWRDQRVRVVPLGPVRTVYAAPMHPRRPTVRMDLVTCRVKGESEPREIAIERFEVSQ